VTPTLLIPGLLCSARLYAEQIPELWRFGPVTVADHTGGESIAEVAERILADAPPRFALAGLSMGGYIAFEIVRRAPERIERLALLDTMARADPPDHSERRRRLIALTRDGRFDDVADLVLPLLFYRQTPALRDLNRLMAQEVGPDAFVRQQTAIIARPDSRPVLAGIRCPTLVLVGDHDQVTPPELSEEMAAAIPGARLMVVPDCGHGSTLEQPRQVTRALVEWMCASAHN
jgi:pimeloyl-ACP methyl ester carboxylesterase